LKSLRTKILAMLLIVASGAIASAGLSLYALSKANSLNARSSIQGDIALVTERSMASSPAWSWMRAASTCRRRRRKPSPSPRAWKAASRSCASWWPISAAGAVRRAERAGQIEKAIADFITFRSETVRLGREVSTAAANAQGNNDLNRANRKGLNDLLVAFSKRNEDAGNALGDEAAAFTKQVQWILPAVLLAALLASLAAAMLFAQRSITKPLLDLAA
jgi:methyl-accepting chemotaxis protein